MRLFLNKERERIGWRFWLLFVIATNLGWFPGIGLGMALAKLVEAQELWWLKALVSALPPALLFGVLQAWVLARHRINFWGWFVACAAGWTTGVLLAEGILLAAFPDWEGLWRIVLLGALAGMWMGISQAFVLGRFFNRLLWWWVPLSFVGWAVLFPGAIPGAVLMWLLGRHLR